MFDKYSNEFARRYANMTESADEQRSRDMASSQEFATEVQNEMSAEVGAPPAPEAPTEGTGQFDPQMDREANVEATKNEMLRKGRDRMNAVVAPDF